VEFEAEQPGFGAAHRVGAQDGVGKLDHPLGADGLDPDVKRPGLARRIDAGLDQPHIFLEDRILRRDPQGKDAVQPALDRWQLVEQCAMLIDEFQTGDDLELFEPRTRQLPRMEKVIPLGERLARISAFEIVSRVEEILPAGLALAAGQRTQTVEAARDRADEAPLALAVGGDRSEHRRHRLVRAMRPPEPLDCDIGAPAGLEQEMNAPLRRARAAKIGMIGTAGSASVRKDEDRLTARHESIGFGDVRARAPPLELLLAVSVNDDAPGPARNLRDHVGPEMGDEIIERGRYGRHRT